MIKKCVICGKKFESNGNTAKYCSDKCHSKSEFIQKHIGEKHNELKIIDAFYKKKKTYVVCECSCGKIFTTRYDAITSEKTKSCGHLTQFKMKDITGEQFGTLTVIRFIRIDKEKGKTYYEVYCSNCKRYKIMSYGNIKKAKSCGCLNEQRAINAKKAVKESCIDGTSVQMLHSIVNGNRKPSKSGVIGVTWKKDRRKWKAEIIFKKKTYFLGYYDDLKDATEVRKAAEQELFGNFLEWYEKEYKEKKYDQKTTKSLKTTKLRPTFPYTLVHFGKQ